METDALSCREDKNMPTLTAEEEAEQAEYVHQLHKSWQNHHSCNPAVRLDTESLFSAQTKDPLLTKVSMGI